MAEYHHIGIEIVGDKDNILQYNLASDGPALQGRSGGCFIFYFSGEIIPKKRLKRLSYY
jgi:hypothetical protein